MLQQWLNGLTAQTAGEGAAGGAFGMLFPFILIFAAMYFLIIRPQQKQAKKQQLYLTQLKKGDEVVLQSGLFGRIHSVGDIDVMVDLGPNVRVRVLKSTVSGPAPAPKGAETPDSDAKKS